MNKELIESIMNDLKDSSWRTRQQALFRADNIDDPDFVEGPFMEDIIKTGIKYEDYELRITALALCYKRPKFFNFVCDALYDENINVRMEAICFLTEKAEQIEDPNIIYRMIISDNYLVRVAGYKACSNPNIPIEMLNSGLSDTNFVVRDIATRIYNERIKKEGK